MSRGDINGNTRLAGVVGSPVAHSLSPAIHNAWLAASGVDGAYVAFAPSPDRFEAFMGGLRFSGIAGVNVTSPFKQRALALADTVDPSARAAGAANLLVFGSDGSIGAHNTDGHGLLAAIAREVPSWTPDARPTVVLGAGGAGRGAVAALVAAGGEVRVVNRTVDRAEALAADFAGVSPFGPDGLRDAMRDAGALVNAAPGGAWAVEAVAPGLDGMATDAVVMDMVYTPLRTPLLERAEARGLQAVDGLAMLIEQGRPSFAAFFGREAPHSADVRAVALRSLDRAR